MDPTARESTRHQGSASPLVKDYPIENATVIEAAPGDVAFFHYFTLHGSMPNRSDRIRKTILVQMYAGDDMVEEDNRHPDCRMPLRGWNHRMSRTRTEASQG